MRTVEVGNVRDFFRVIFFINVADHRISKNVIDRTLHHSDIAYSFIHLFIYSLIKVVSKIERATSFKKFTLRWGKTMKRKIQKSK